MSAERATRLAVELMKLGVSRAGVIELLSFFPHDEIEKQLKYLPFRKAKRPGALVVEAIRHNYSPPKEFFYATIPTEPAKAADALDQGSEPTIRPTDAESEGHGASTAPGVDPSDGRLSPGGSTCDLVLPEPDETDRPQA
jgi:hypothetical protein